MKKNDVLTQQSWWLSFGGQCGAATNHLPSSLPAIPRFFIKNINIYQIILLAAVIGVVVLVFCSTDAFALTSAGKFGEIGDSLVKKLMTWKTRIYEAAEWMFWTLGAISLTWTLGALALQKADLREFFAEFIRFILFFGFFLWLLTNGFDIATDIFASFDKISPETNSPTSIVDTAFNVLKKGSEYIQMPFGPPSFRGGTGPGAVGPRFGPGFGPPTNLLTSMFLVFACFMLVVAIAINLAMIYAAEWFLLYAGIFFLGFGGTRWTSDVAINYYKAVLAVGMQCLCMSMIISVADGFIKDCVAQLEPDKANINELAVLLFVCLTFFVFSSRIPAMIASIITGGANFGDFSDWTTSSSLVSSATMLSHGAASVASSITALKTAAMTTNENIQTRSEVFSSILGNDNDSDSSTSHNISYGEAAGWYSGSSITPGGAGPASATETVYKSSASSVNSEANQREKPPPSTGGKKVQEDAGTTKKAVSIDKEGKDDVVRDEKTSATQKRFASGDQQEASDAATPGAGAGSAADGIKAIKTGTSTSKGIAQADSEVLNRGMLDSQDSQAASTTYAEAAGYATSQLAGNQLASDTNAAMLNAGMASSAASGTKKALHSSGLAAGSLQSSPETLASNQLADTNAAMLNAGMASSAASGTKKALHSAVSAAGSLQSSPETLASNQLADTNAAMLNAGMASSAASDTKKALHSSVSAAGSLQSSPETLASNQLAGKQPAGSGAEMLGAGMASFAASGTKSLHSSVSALASNQLASNQLEDTNAAMLGAAVELKKALNMQSSTKLLPGSTSDNIFAGYQQPDSNTVMMGAAAPLTGFNVRSSSSMSMPASGQQANFNAATTGAAAPLTALNEQSGTAAGIMFAGSQKTKKTQDIPSSNAGGSILPGSQQTNFDAAAPRTTLNEQSGTAGSIMFAGSQKTKKTQDIPSSNAGGSILQSSQQANFDSGASMGGSSATDKTLNAPASKVDNVDNKAISQRTDSEAKAGNNLQAGSSAPSSKSKTYIAYIENKSAGPKGVAARIGRVLLLKEDESLYYLGNTYDPLQRDDWKSNYIERETGDYYWISICRKDGMDALYPINVEIDDDVREEYWVKVRGIPENKHISRFRIVGDGRQIAY